MILNSMYPVAEWADDLHAHVGLDETVYYMSSSYLPAVIQLMSRNYGENVLYISGKMKP